MLAFLRKFRLFFLAVPVIYIIVLAGVALARSSARRSVVTGFRFQEDNSGGSASSAVNNSVSNVHLEQFERVEFRAGNPLWSVKAKDARYYPAESVTLVNEPTLRIYRNREEDVSISGDAARLNIAGSALNQARMDGNVRGSLGGGVTFQTTQGNYNVTNKTFETREQMVVLGQGFEVSGMGFVIHLESGAMEFQQRVSSVFRSGAVAPKALPGFGSLGGGKAEQPAPKRNTETPPGASKPEQRDKAKAEGTGKVSSDKPVAAERLGTVTAGELTTAKKPTEETASLERKADEKKAVEKVSPLKASKQSVQTKNAQVKEKTQGNSKASDGRAARKSGVKSVNKAVAAKLVKKQRRAR